MTAESIDVERARNSAATKFVLVRSYWDRSGAISAFGPFPSVDAALEAKPFFEELIRGDSTLEVMPLFSLGHIT